MNSSENNYSKQAEELLDKWQAKLIDFSKRNILLNYRASKTRHFDITDVSIDWINTFFLDKDTKVLLLWEENVPEIDSTTLPFMKLKIDPKDYYRRLRYLRNEARKFIEETSINILYLAAGFVRYKDSPVESKYYLAPLVLIPVQIIPSNKKMRLHYAENIPEDERVFPKSMFFLRLIDDEVVTNPALIQYFDSNFDVKIDEFKESEESLIEYIEKLRVTVSSSTDFDIFEGGVVGFFTFHKFIIYRDLKNNREKILLNPIFQSLAGIQLPINAGIQFPEEEELDDIEIPDNTFQILDADSSQRKAILASKRGANFVLQGPPGTGKSQTIANIISEFIGNNKSVLFVSEKKAALDVVYKRLASKNLESYLLDLHSTKQTKKKEFYEKMKLALEERDEYSLQPTAKLHEAFSNLTLTRSELNKITKIINETRTPLNYTLYELYGNLAKLEKIPTLSFLLPFDMISLDRFNRNVLLLEEFEQFGEHLERFLSSIWIKFSRKNLSFSEKNELQQIVENYREPFIDVEKIWSNILKLLGIGFDIKLLSLEGNSRWIEYLTFVLENKEPVPYEWLMNDEICQKGSEIIPIDAIKHDLNRLKVLEEYIKESYLPSIEDLPIDKIKELLETEYSSWLKRFIKKGKYKKIIRALEAHSRIAQITGLNYRQALHDVRSISDFRRLSKWQKDKEVTLKPLLGKYYRGNASDWEVIRVLFDSVKEGFDLINLIYQEHTNKKIRLYSISNDKTKSWADSFNKFLEMLGFFMTTKLDESLSKNLKSEIVELSRKISSLQEINFKLIRYFELGDLGIETMEKLLANLKQLRNTLDESEVFIQLRLLLIRIEKTELKEFIREAIDNRITQFCLSYKKQTYYSLILYYQQQFSELQWLKEKRDGLIKRFKDLDMLIINSTDKRIHTNNVKTTRKIWADKPLGEERILQREFNKKRRHLPIRLAFKLAPKKILELKPVMFLSPLSVSHFLDPNLISFDLVIFDEASQIRPEDALGAIIRGKQVIIVGDSKQMPPTSFFSSVITEDENEVSFALEELSEGLNLEEALPLDSSQLYAESILEACNYASFPSLMLRFHYRSRNEDLIAFSNSYFYNNRLYTFPSPHKKNPGLQLVYVENGIYDRARSRTNRHEAKKAADLVWDLIRHYPDYSIGVVGFSKAQERAIEDAFEKHHYLGERLDELLSKGREPLFIKNLETVQGDERDIIIISIGYGKDHSGRFIQNFGPVTKFGGEKRFNVLISRARRKTYVLTSVHPKEYPANSRNKNFEMVRQYLLWSWTHDQSHLNPKVSPISMGGTESPFEEAVLEFLQEKGYEVDTQVGVSGYRIDLAVVHPETKNYVIAIECDGATYHSTKTARDRDRIRENVLRRLGWEFYRVWSNDWFYNPKNAKKNLLVAINNALKTHNERMTEARKQVPTEDAETKGFFKKVKKIKKENNLRQEIGVKYQSARVPKAKENLSLTRDYSPRGYKYVERSQLLEIQIRTILQKETPIHHEVMLKNLLRGWNQKVLTRKARQVLERHLEKNSYLYYKSGLFYWQNKLQKEEWMKLKLRRPSSVRDKINYIPSEEVAVLMVHIMKDQGSMLEKELYRAVSFFYENNTRVVEAELAIYKEAFRLVKEAGLVKFIEGYWRWMPTNNSHPEFEVVITEKRDNFIHKKINFPSSTTVMLKGVSYEGRHENLVGATFGEKLVLKRDENNPYDPNAVKVYFKGKEVGFVPQKTAAWLGPAIDQGHTFSAKIIKIYTPYNYKYPVVKIEVKKRILSHD